MDRNALVTLIAAAIKRSLTWIDDDQARAIADTILRDLKAAGLGIHKRRPRR